uniref:Uncharacterized protein n=1 Tax=Myotis myotis TaxID=51298 RepID=A0A7J8AMT8_MYOMY|nr:hypothetical protein mMyoMyo1_008028 [Myotis myotis]
MAAAWPPSAYTSAWVGHPLRGSPGLAAAQSPQRWISRFPGRAPSMPDSQGELGCRESTSPGAEHLSCAGFAGFMSPILPSAAPAPRWWALGLLGTGPPCVFVSSIRPPAAPAPRWRGLGMLGPDGRHKHTGLPLGFAAPAPEPSGFAP